MFLSRLKSIKAKVGNSVGLLSNGIFWSLKREEQGDESEEFCELFENGLNYVEGKE